MTSAPATYNNGLYVVKGVGAFTNTATYDFTNLTSLPEGLVASRYTVNDMSGNPGAKYNHRFIPANVVVSDGFLQLKVPGGQTKSPLLCAEVSTTESKILHASVRTLAMFDAVPGTCSAAFFYYSDDQEIDIEWLSDPNSESNPQNGSTPMHYTNQNIHGNHNRNTYAEGAAPETATSGLHEYRIDWVGGSTRFYLDGVLQDTFTTNVPTTPGNWIWNNWSNGDKGWSVGPPAADNIYKIQKITMYYNVGT